MSICVFFIIGYHPRVGLWRLQEEREADDKGRLRTTELLWSQKHTWLQILTEPVESGILLAVLIVTEG